MIANLSVGYENEAYYERALDLANRLSLTINNESEQRLLVTDKLVLQLKSLLPLYTDFNRATWQKRRDAGKKQGLVRACKPVPGLRIIDATAGWGRDAAILASFGAQVLMLERNPIMAALLEDGLLRQDERSQHALAMSLIQQDAYEYLQSLSEKDYPDVIYIDPMHPARQKSALVKKDLQVLQDLIGEDKDAERLIELAKSRVLQKVVVKWPQHQPALVKPSSCIEGKTVRFDIYLR